MSEVLADLDPTISRNRNENKQNLSHAGIAKLNQTEGFTNSSPLQSHFQGPTPSDLVADDCSRRVDGFVLGYGWDFTKFGQWIGDSYSRLFRVP